MDQEIEQIRLPLDEIEAREVAIAEAIERGFRTQPFLEKRYRY